MPVDIRATVACSLGTVISGNVNEEYVQGTGLIKCSGTVVINGIITPAIGTAVTFAYTKSGITRSIPRKLRVLSSFADPFRRTTSVELGCKLTYLSDKRDSIDWTAFDDPSGGLFIGVPGGSSDYGFGWDGSDPSGVLSINAGDSEIITVPIRAQVVAQKCMNELGINGTFTLTNKFSVAEFDLSPGYVQVLSDLLVSESLCGYLDANEVLQVFSLDQPGGTGPVLDVTQLVDISKIGVGQLPGEAVTVSYSSLKLKQDVRQPDPSGNNGGGGGGGETEWTRNESSSASAVIIPWGEGRAARYNILEVTITVTDYGVIKTKNGETQRLPTRRTTTVNTQSPAVLGKQFSEYFNNNISINSTEVQKVAVETFRYDDEGREVFWEKQERGGIAYLVGGVSVPVAFSPTDFVSFAPNSFIDLGRETRQTIYVNDTSQVITKSYGHWYRTIQGQQAIAEGRLSFTTSAQSSNYINSLINIGLIQIESRTELQTAGKTPSAPSIADINNQQNAKGGDASNGYRTESKADLALALGSATAQRRVEFSLPYAPDDVFFKGLAGGYSSAPSDAAQKAQLYGRVQNRLLLGNRNGMNLQCAPEILPGAPFAPFIVKSGSTSALYRTNGSNWTFDAQGLVASTDALFWGGVGGNAGESWFPVAPGITTLPTTPGTTTVNITDASGNVVGSYQQMTVTGTVPVAQETVALQATLRVRPVVTSLPYALQQTAEVAIATRLRAVVSSIKAISIPAAAVTVAGLAPKVSTGARVLVPAATVQVAAQVPGVSSGASVAIPATGITVAGVVPDVVGRQKTIITVPVATVQMTGLVPLVASGASVAVPAAGIAVAGLVPAVTTLATDPSFASVSLLLRMDGSNGSTTITDNSSNAHTITVFGNAQLTTADKKYGTAALTLDGTGDYVMTPADADFAFGTGDFTVECWCKPTVVNSNDGLFTFGGLSSGLFLASFTSNWYLGTAGSGGTNMGAATAGSWRHIAVTRSGTSLRLFINGTQLGSTLTNSTNLTGNQLKIGYYYDSTFGFVGLIDEFRVTKGIARYTSNFTAPTAAFPGA